MSAESLDSFLPFTIKKRDDRTNYNALFFITFHAALAVIGHGIVLIAAMVWYFRRVQVPDYVMASGFHDTLTSPQFRYALVASISTGTVLLLNLFVGGVEVAIKTRTICLPLPALSDERFLRLIVISALIVPSLTLFCIPNDPSIIVYSCMVSDLRNVSIFCATLMGLTATFDTTLFQRRRHLCFTLCIFFSFFLHCFQLQLFQMTSEPDRYGSLALKIVVLGSAIVGGIGLLMLMSYHYFCIAYVCFRESFTKVSIGEWVFVVYSLPVGIAVTQYIIIVCIPGYGGYWTTSLFNLIFRELLVVIYAVISALVPARLLRHHALFVQAQINNTKSGITTVLNHPMQRARTELDTILQKLEERERSSGETTDYDNDNDIENDRHEVSFSRRVSRVDEGQGPSRSETIHENLKQSLARVAYACHLACSSLQTIADDSEALDVVSVLLSLDLLDPYINGQIRRQPVSIYADGDDGDEEEDVNGGHGGADVLNRLQYQQQRQEYYDVNVIPDILASVNNSNNNDNHHNNHGFHPVATNSSGSAMAAVDMLVALLQNNNNNNHNHNIGNHPNDHHHTFNHLIDFHHRSIQRSDSENLETNDVDVEVASVSGSFSRLGLSSSSNGSILYSHPLFNRLNALLKQQSQPQSQPQPRLQEYTLSSSLSQQSKSSTHDHPNRPTLELNKMLMEGSESGVGMNSTMSDGDVSWTYLPQTTNNLPGVANTSSMIGQFTLKQQQQQQQDLQRHHQQQHHQPLNPVPQTLSRPTSTTGREVVATSTTAVDSHSVVSQKPYGYGYMYSYDAADGASPRIAGYTIENNEKTAPTFKGTNTWLRRAMLIRPRDLYTRMECVERGLRYAMGDENNGIGGLHGLSVLDEDALNLMELVESYKEGNKDETTGEETTWKPAQPLSPPRESASHSSPVGPVEIRSLTHTIIRGFSSLSFSQDTCASHVGVSQPLPLYPWNMATDRPTEDVHDELMQNSKEELASSMTASRKTMHPSQNDGENKKDEGTNVCNDSSSSSVPLDSFSHTHDLSHLVHSHLPRVSTHRDPLVRFSLLLIDRMHHQLVGMNIQLVYFLCSDLRIIPYHRTFHWCLSQKPHLPPSINPHSLSYGTDTMDLFVKVAATFEFPSQIMFKKNATTATMDEAKKSSSSSKSSLQKLQHVSTSLYAVLVLLDKVNPINVPHNTSYQC